MAMDNSSDTERSQPASEAGIPADVFHKLYEDQPPWEIGRPQPEIVRMADAGMFHGDLLDVGCGSGENAIYLARHHGCSVLGVDFVPAAIEQARQKADAHGLKADFLVHDALQVHQLGRTFDVVLDSGTFHVLSDEHRQAYVNAVSQVARPGGRLVLLCFCEAETRDRGPRRVTQDEIRANFADAWVIERIEAARYEVSFYGDGARNWLATMRRKQG